MPKKLRTRAYEDVPLPIGAGQTISQPYIVALMVHALELHGSDQVLEVGTGSGYQAAILAELAQRVISVERICSLANTAVQRLKEAGSTNVEVVLSERKLGWEKEAPYDAIIVAAGAYEMPRDLVGQLAVRGRMVVPVGSLESQKLIKVTKSAYSYSETTLCTCKFVPLIGEGAWPDPDKK